MNKQNEEIDGARTDESETFGNVYSSCKHAICSAIIVIAEIC